MYLIVTSAEDVASMNIREKLLELANWKNVGEFDGSPVLAQGPFSMIRIPNIHLETNDLDKRVEKELDLKPDCVIFASRHKSQSGLRTLTVHPIGNYGEALFGGREKTIVPSAPRVMTQALLLLRKYAGDLDFQISFECTHHGPYLETPCFFIEIGSSEDAWPEEAPGKALAKVILELASAGQTENDVIGVGVGGGHYAPRHSDIVRAHSISLGHMIPSYAIDKVDDDIIRRVIEKTPGCEVVYFHKKAMKKPEYKEIKALFEGHGLRTVSSSDLAERVE